MRRFQYIDLLLLLIFVVGCKTPSILVTEEQQKGDLYNNRHDYTQAILHYEKMLAASSKLGTYRNLDMEAEVCRKIAHAFNVQGEFQRGMHHILRAFELDSMQGNDLEIIEDYREMGKIHLYLGDFPEGIRYLQKALSLNEGMDQSIKGINQISVADTYLTLSRLYRALGDFQQAETYGLKAYQIFETQDNREGEMESLLQLGKNCIEYGSIKRGQAYIRSSLHMATDLGLNLYRHKEALALVSENRAMYEEALRLKLEAMDEARDSRNLPQIIWAQMRTGDLYQLIGDQQQARGYYQEAINYLDSSQIRASSLEASINLRAGDIDQAHTYFSSSGSRVAAGIASMRLGEVALEWKAWQEAHQHFKEALEYFSLAGVEDGMARALILAATTDLALGNLKEASSMLLEAETHVQYDETRWRMHYTRGRLFESLSLPDSAIEAYITAIEVIETIRGNFSIEEYKSLYLEDKMEVYDHLIRLLMEGGRSDESFHYSERARARTFLDMMGGGRMHIRPDESSELVAMEQKLRQELQSLSRLMRKDDLSITRSINRSQLQQEIYDIRREYNDVVRRIKLFNPEYSAIVNMEVAPVHELQEEIDSKTAFLVYWVGEKNLNIWMITSEEFQGRTIAISEDEMIDLVSQSRRSISSRQHAGIFSQCYTYLIKPFEEALKAFETIGIVPHLPLHFLPYQSLMPDSSSYLIDSFNLFYTPSVNTYSLTRKKTVTPQGELFAMALGGLELGGLSGLPGTTREVSHISTLFSNPTVTYEKSSTEAYFKSTVMPFKYIHLATHGILDQRQPLYSYLLLAPTAEEDGQLTVSEVFGLNMNAYMVVLSACETALGSMNRGDEIVGLSRAFIYAGSRNVIVSLWNVADESTAYLMSRFYSNLENLSPVQSLRLAQIATREKYDTPVYWAPFQLIGAGD